MARRTLHDHYFKLAKAEGYLARSAYKLDQIQDARRIIRPGDYVLDLGCAPGAWLQVASRLVGPKGRVFGIDLQPLTHRFESNVAHRVGDIYESDPREMVDAAGRPFDVVLSDMAPKTTGFNEHELSIRLCDRVLDLLPALLRSGGNLAMKAFEGAMYPELLARAGTLFKTVKGYKPKASRDVSREMYVVGQCFQPPPSPGHQQKGRGPGE